MRAERRALSLQYAVMILAVSLSAMVACAVSQDAQENKKAVALLDSCPALFVEDSGNFVHRGKGANILLSEDGVTFQFFRDTMPRKEIVLCPDFSDAFRVTFPGSRTVRPEGLGKSDAQFNYYTGNDPAQWRSDLPTFEKVVYRNLYPGIDLVVHGLRSHVKYEFIVSPGADCSVISVAYHDILGLSLSDNGGLYVQTALGELVEDAPYVYQSNNGVKHEVACQYLLSDDSRYTFSVTGDYDRNAALIIDPDLSWSTYLGDTWEDCGYGIATDAEGNVFVSGETGSSAFPTPNGWDTSFNGYQYNAFVSKFDPAGRLLWSTFLGGSGYNSATGIATDRVGNVFVTGETRSSDFPTPNGWDASYNGPGICYGDAFVAKFSSNGALLWSTYLGGSADDWGRGIAADGAGNVFVTGSTSSSDLPTPSGWDPSFGGGEWGDAFVAKFDPAGVLLWSTYLGGSGDEWGNGIAANGEGNVFVTGWTRSSDFPTPNGWDTSHNGYEDAFVAKFDSGGALLWSTYLGGSWNSDHGNGIATDAEGNVFVTGFTLSSNFPTPNGWDTSSNGYVDAFIAKFESGGALLWSTFLGGSSGAMGHGIATDGGGNVFVTGYTDSVDFPTSCGWDTSYNGGDEDAFVAKFSSEGLLLWSTFLGGSGDDYGIGIAVDGRKNAFVTGFTWSTNFPTPNGRDTSYNNSNNDGWCDAFVAKFTELTYSLSVQSTPVTGVGITGTPAGTTNYSTAQFVGTLVSLTAPATAGITYVFDRWTINGVPKPASRTAVSFNINSDTTAVASYQEIVETVFPAVPTSCPAVDTTCPPAATSCPIVSTSCPPAATACPAVETRCPSCEFAILSFGHEAEATDLYDEGIDALVPPPSPDGDTVYFSTDDAVPGDKLLADYRAPVPDETSWRLLMTVGAGKTLTVSWDQASLPADKTCTIYAADPDWNPLDEGSDMKADLSSVSVTYMTGTARYLITVTGEPAAEWSVNLTADLLKWPALVVQSTPMTGVVITGTTGMTGTTNYKKYVNPTQVPKTVILTAPATGPAGSGSLPFARWTVNDVSQGDGVRIITLSVSANTTAIAAYQPNEPTISPVVPTQCPAIATSCPLATTTCPPATTACPVINTVCPESATACPGVQTACPPQSTVCPTADTACPPSATNCPPIATQCPPLETNCPPASTSCPAVGTACPEASTSCPPSTTYCPLTTTYCPLIYTSCPLINTLCTPPVATACPVVRTECPPAATSCPPEATLCPALSATLEVKSLPLSGVAITGSQPGTTRYAVGISACPATTVNLTAPLAASLGGTDVEFVRWSVNGVPQDGAEISFLMEADTTCVAEYSVAQRTLTVSSTPITNISVLGSAAGHTPYSARVNDNSVVSLTAREMVWAGATGYKFVRWTVDGVDQADGQKKISYVINADSTAVATYAVGPARRDVFVAVTGTPTGAGTIDDPIDLLTALTANAPKIQAGDNVWIRGGTYVRGESWTKWSGATGTADAPIIYRAYRGEHAVLMTTFGDVLMTVGCPYIQFQGLDVNGSTTAGTGISMCSGFPGIKLINNQAHDTWGAYATHYSPIACYVMLDRYCGYELYGNLTYNSSDHGVAGFVTSTTSPDPAEAVDNVIFNTMNDGIQHDWSSASPPLPMGNMLLEGNIVFLCGRTAGCKCIHLRGAGTDRADNITLRDNVVYSSEDETGHGPLVRIGRAGQTVANGTVTATGNLLFNGDSEGGLSLNCWTTIVSKNNLAFSGQGPAFNVGSVVASSWDPALSTVDNNRYYGSATTILNYGPNGGTASLATWQGWTGWDANSSLAKSYPPAPIIRIRPNLYEEEKAYLAVYNKGGSVPVSVDLSSFVKNGQGYKIVSVENIWGTPVKQGVYNGPVSFVPQGMDVGQVFTAYMVKKTLTLEVESAPLDGAAIEGVPSGTTNYAAELDVYSDVRLTAPQLTDGGDFVRWEINGIAQPYGQTQIAFVMQADTRAVAVYSGSRPTIYPVVPTSCPPSETACPPAQTSCPVASTSCPELSTFCPPVPTACPAEPTECPEMATMCPPALTACPPALTACPPAATACPPAETSCPPIGTACPAVETACPPVVTNCPPADTACPETATACPPVDTACPPAETACPLVETACPPVATGCPTIDTACPQITTACPAEATACPPAATACPPITTTCPAVGTQCPPVMTACPAVSTQCPPVETACPEQPTVCPPPTATLNVRTTPIVGVAISGTHSGTTNYTRTGIDLGTHVKLTAPKFQTIRHKTYKLYRWTLDGAAKKKNRLSVEFDMNTTPRTAVAVYKRLW